MELKRFSTRTVVGLLVVLVGLVLLLDTTGVADTGDLLLYVPSLFVLAGLYALVASGLRNLVGPVVVVLLAGGWQLVTLDLVTADQLWQFWPVFVVLFGLSLLTGWYRGSGQALDDSAASVFALFGARDARVVSKQFERADLTALFGGVELDLRDAEVSTVPARVNATALFGGVDVVVPRDWNVTMDVLPVLGAAEDDRMRRESTHEEVDLVVTGFAAFGAISVTD